MKTLQLYTTCFSFSSSCHLGGRGVPTGCFQEGEGLHPKAHTKHAQRPVCTDGLRGVSEVHQRGRPPGRRRHPLLQTVQGRKILAQPLGVLLPKEIPAHLRTLLSSYNKLWKVLLLACPWFHVSGHHDLAWKPHVGFLKCLWCVVMKGCDGESGSHAVVLFLPGRWTSAACLVNMIVALPCESPALIMFL